MAFTIFAVRIARQLKVNQNLRDLIIYVIKQNTPVQFTPSIRHVQFIPNITFHSTTVNVLIFTTVHARRYESLVKITENPDTKSSNRNEDLPIAVPNQPVSSIQATLYLRERNHLKKRPNETHKIAEIKRDGQCRAPYPSRFVRAYFANERARALILSKEWTTPSAVAYISRWGLSLSFYQAIPGKSSNEYRGSFYFSQRENIAGGSYLEFSPKVGEDAACAWREHT